MRKLALFLSLVVAVCGQNCLLSDSEKKDCGYAGIDSNACVAKGCCWSPAGQNSATPWCFYSGQSSSYALDSIAETAYGFSGTLSKSSSAYSANEDISKLKLDVFFQSESTIRVRIKDAGSSRWEIPSSVIPREDSVLASASKDYSFSYTNSPFSFEIKRTSDGSSLFKSSDSLIFKDQYIELTTTIDSKAKTFGLGESARTSHALHAGQTYTLWAADVASYGKDINLYSSHPFYLQMVNNAAHGVLLMNSNGMDVTLTETSITYKVLGGIIDLYAFVGPTPQAVVSQYTALIGRPSMMPYWSLGYHNCKYGYTSLNQVKEVVANYSAANIPLDTQWMDIDYMQAYKDFTTDPSNFPTSEVKAFVDGLHANGQHFVPIIDPGIMIASGYDAYEQGLKDDIFVKDIKGGNYLGQVWPGPTYFPDFFHPKAQAYWTNQLKGFNDLVGVDGLWIDMNEVSNFCNDNGAGQVCVNSAPEGCPAPGKSQTDCCLVCSTVDSSNKYDFPAYNINNVKGKLSVKTMAMSATHYNNITVYDAHNLYGLTEQIATNKALADIRGKRPFILSRSSFPSTGVHSAKWTGDNGASWDDLKASIVGIMDFNMFGVPMVGADICGFLLDTTEELCARWIEVGAFYPFTRNHNAIGQIPQELYVWSSVAEAGRNALSLRYRILPYLYTAFSEAHFQGLMVAQPLWAKFYNDANAVNIDAQWMLGDDLLISPVITQGATSVNAYFPQGLWYAISATDFNYVPIDATAGGKFVTLSTPLTSINVHVRGGSVLPMQDAAMTTTLARQTPFTLLVALCAKSGAYGSLFWDDGEQIELANYLQTEYKASVVNGSGSLTSTVIQNTYADAAKSTVSTVVVVGAGLSCPTSVSVNGVVKSTASIACAASGANSKVTFSNLGIKLSDAFELTW